MSFTITEAFVQQFGDNIRHLGQQRTSRLSPFVGVESGIVGTSKSTERLAKTDSYQLTNRHGDTQYVGATHSRRWLDLSDWAWSDLVDEMDKIKMLVDPTSDYAKAAVMALNRRRDQLIYDAARGNSRSPSGNIALPAGQKIAVGGAGLTLAKILQAKEILDAAEVDDEMEDDGQSPNMAAKRVMVVTTKQITNLLGTTEIKSIDYNNVKALAQGQVDTFCGFKFVRADSIVAKVGSDRFCVAWSRGCVNLGVGMDQMTSIDRLPNKNYSVQVYARQSLGAVRVEDEGVVEIACLES